MSSLTESLNRLKSFRKSVEAEDQELAQETMEAGTDVITEGNFRPQSIEAEIEKESIIQRKNRPALKVKDDTAELDFAHQAESVVWKQRLLNAKPILDKAILAVGRIDLLNSTDMSWVGTGWLLDDDTIVTNRHVAEMFVSHSDGQFQFMQNGSALIDPQIDFVREFDSSRENTFKLLDALYVVPAPGPDMALFRVAQTGSNGNLPEKIALADKPAVTLQAATIGYPAFDSRIPDAELMVKIYGTDFEKKRLAPGAVIQVDSNQLQHDCTTLGGNSGSAIIDVNRTADNKPVAIGLHFAGAFLKANYAVPSDLVANVLRQVKNGKRPYQAKEQQHTTAPPRPPAQSNINASHDNHANGSVSFTIPLQISVSLGQPAQIQANTTTSTITATPQSTAGAATPVASATDDFSDDDEIELATEARPEDYNNRNGYQENFIGNGDFIASLPQITDVADVLTFDNQGHSEQVLHYQHFSVVMKASRRLLYYSAANLDGTNMQRVPRPKWRLDPRIPKDSQIIVECYGNPPKFSRGHMTRKNDVGWGSDAVRGVTDTMHVTNAAPQMQSFNSPIWLELEDYALDNAVKDGMRISVFTGPYFTNDDPIYHGVKVPVGFWKIIVFKHDITGKLSATGYEMDQSQSLPSEDEFVFGAFTSTRLNVAAQVPIRQIEAKSGINFGLLKDSDPLATISETISAAQHPLQSRSQIRFT